MRGLLIGHDEAVYNWALGKYQFVRMPFDRVFGIVDGKEGLVGAILFQHYNGCNIELSYYGKGTLTAGIIRTITKSTMLEFNPSRVTVITSKKNKRIIRSLGKLGFRLEGIQRYFYGHTDCTRNTGVRLVMFRDRLDQLSGVKPVIKKVN